PLVGHGNGHDHGQKAQGHRRTIQRAAPLALLLLLVGFGAGYFLWPSGASTARAEAVTEPAAGAMPEALPAVKLTPVEDEPSRAEDDSPVEPRRVEDEPPIKKRRSERRRSSSRRRLTLVTEPPGLVLENADTGARLGRSPVVLTLRTVDLPLRVQAVTSVGVSVPVLVTRTMPAASVREHRIDFAPILRRIQAPSGQAPSEQAPSEQASGGQAPNRRSSQNDDARSVRSNDGAAAGSDTFEDGRRRAIRAADGERGRATSLAGSTADGIRRTVGPTAGQSETEAVGRRFESEREPSPSPRRPSPRKSVPRKSVEFETVDDDQPAFETVD
ncbi:MAG: hypothetical protein AAFN74_07155, partial [Myxococcota bacterium]